MGTTNTTSQNCQGEKIKMCYLSRELTGRRVLTLVTFVCLFQATLTQKNVMEMKLQGSEPLSLLWGIGDATAYIGRLFTYTLPSDAFQGNVVRYNINEVGKDTLPDWLTFNALKAELKGIPGQQNKGRVYLEVKAIGDDQSSSDDVFSIEILEDTFGPITAVPAVAKSGPKDVKCSKNEPQTVVTVILDCDMDTMLPGNRIGLLDNMASHLNLAPEMMKIMPVGDKPMFDNTALVSGPGNCKQPHHAGLLVSWLVGCGKVDQDHMQILQLLETSAANGDMTGALGHGIIGWHVTNTRFQEKVRRKRAVTQTPTMMVPVPTSVVESSTEETSKPAMEATSAYIMPTQTIDIQPTKVVTSSSSSTVADTSTIAPTTTTKMEQTTVPTTTTTTKPVIVTKPMPTTPPTTTTTKKPTTTSTTTTTPKPPVRTLPPLVDTTPEPECPPPGRMSNKPPMLKNPINDITVESGVIKKIKIPDDTFFDCNDGDTNDLDLELKLDSNNDIPSDFWLKVIKRPSRPYNILMNPLNTNAGSYTFKLKATNYYDKSTSQDLNIVVLGEEMAEQEPNHELSMTIDYDYEKFMSDLESRVDLSNKVAGLYGDKNSKYLTVTRIEKGSVVYAWTNNSLSGSGCPVDSLKSNVGKLVDEKGNLTPEVLDAMQPYKINSIASAPLGACTNNPNFPARSARRASATTPTAVAPTQAKTDAPMVKPDSTIKYVDKSTTMKPMEKTTANVAAAGAGGGSDMWITTVVPAIVVVVVLIVALVIACCLYKKKRQGRMKLKEKDHFASNKGVPVIFADEYEEKPNDSTRPLIMEDEKPPMPPPEYPRASSETSGNSNSTQPIEDNVEEIELDDTSYDINSPLYSPPPPVTASSNSKPPHVQSSRGPPPYVPP